MAFSLDDLSDVAALNKNRTRWSYDTEDALATALGSGYFDSAGKILRAGDTVELSAADGTATLKVTAAGAGAVTVSAMGGALSANTLAPGSVERSVVEELRDIAVPVTRFGARGDGSTDDRTAIELAGLTLSQAGGGTLLFPPGDYFVGDAPAKVYSNITYQGVGSGRSRIVNSQEAVNFWNRCAFLAGMADLVGINSATSSANLMPYKALDAVTAGDRQVTCTTAADAAAYTEGTWICICTTTGTTSSGVFFPDEVFWAKIETVTVGTGVLRLDRPVPFVMATARAHYFDGIAIGTAVTEPYFAVENVWFKDLGFEAEMPWYGAAWFGGGIERCAFGHFRGIQSNCLVDWSMRDCNGHFWAAANEFKFASQNVVAEHNQFRYRQKEGFSNTETVVGLGEGAYNITWRDNDFIADDNWADETILLSKSEKVHFIGNRVHQFGNPSYLVRVAGSNNAQNRVTRRVWIEDNLFHTPATGSAVNYGIQIGGGETYAPYEVWVQRNTLIGALINPDYWLNVAAGVDRVFLRDNNAPAGYGATIDATATNVVRQGNVGPTGGNLKLMAIPINMFRQTAQQKDFLPVTANGTNMGLDHTFGSPLKGTSTNNTASVSSGGDKAAVLIAMPVDYVEAATAKIVVRCHVTALRFVAAAVDCEVKALRETATADMVTTASISINDATTWRDITFELDETLLDPDDQVLIRLYAYNDDLGGNSAGQIEISNVWLYYTSNLSAS